MLGCEALYGAFDSWGPFRAGRVASLSLPMKPFLALTVLSILATEPLTFLGRSRGLHLCYSFSLAAGPS